MRDLILFWLLLFAMAAMTIIARHDRHELHEQVLQGIEQRCSK